MTRQALDGFRVIDFTQSVAGAHCTMVLADLGAEVIKVESMAGDGGLRRRFFKVKGADPAFTAFNRNKKSVSLNFKAEDARGIVQKLLAEAEVVVVDTALEQADSLGLDYERLKKTFPRLIYAEITPFGESGPYRSRPMFEGTVQAESGMSQSLLNNSGKAPYLVGGRPAEISCGMAANIAIQGALHQLTATGRGQKIVSSMYAAFTFMFSMSMMDYLFNHVEKPVDGNAPNCFLQTRTGWIRVSCGDGPIWDRTRELIDDPFLNEARFQDPAVRLEHQGAIIDHVQRWAEGYTAQEIMELFTEKGIPCGKVRTVEELRSNEHLLERKQIVEIDVDGVGPLPYFADPCMLKDSPVDYRQAPKLGEHTREVLRELLRFSEDEISALERRGSIGSAGKEMMKA